MSLLTETIKRYIGLSTETKLTLEERDVDSRFFETDSQLHSVWDGTTWRPFSNAVSMQMADSSSVDAFGKQKVTQPVNIFENKNIHGRNKSQWEEPIVGAIIVHGAVTGGPFQVAETVTGGTSGNIGTITVVDVGSLTITYTVNHNDFVDGETITGGTSGATAAVTTHNTGSHVSHDRDTASVILQVGQLDGDQAIRQTHRYFSYVPGKATEVGLTFNFGTAVANVRRRSGYFDADNGIFLEQTTSGISWNVRSSTSGSPVPTSFARVDWNYDSMDGEGPSGIDLDFTKSQFLVVDLQWQGDGRVRCGFYHNGAIKWAHYFLFSNTLTSVYMSTPSLPVRHEITNTGATASTNTMREVCSAIVSMGGENPSGLGFSASHEITARGVTAEAPVLAIRLKNVHPNGGANRVTIQLSSMGLFVLTNNAHFHIEHVHSPSGITATWTDVGGGSATEYSTDISAVTANPGHKIDEGYIASGQGGKGANENEIAGDKLDQHRFVTQNFDSTNSEMFVIFATAFTGTSNVYAHISWIEFE